MVANDGPLTPSPPHASSAHAQAANTIAATLEECLAMVNSGATIAGRSRYALEKPSPPFELHLRENGAHCTRTGLETETGSGRENGVTSPRPSGARAHPA